MKFTVPHYHTAIIASDPAVTGGVIILIRLTELRERWDDCCVLTSDDYKMLTKKTVPAYSTAAKLTATEMQKAIDDGGLTVLDPIPKTALNKILKGAQETDQLSPSILRHIAKPT